MMQRLIQISLMKQGRWKHIPRLYNNLHHNSGKCLHMQSQEPKHSTTNASHVESVPVHPIKSEIKKEIMVHDKYKIQIALCIDRFPLNFVQEEFEKEFERFRDEWLLKTKNHLEVQEDFLHMNYNLESFKEEESTSDGGGSVLLAEDQRTTQAVKEQTETITERMGETEKEQLEELLSFEGIEEILQLKKKRRKKEDSGEQKQITTQVDESDYTNINRKPNDFLYLLVQYKNIEKWMFPLIDYSKHLTIRETLNLICSEHLKCEMPFFIGYSPCTFEKRKYKKPLVENEIIGRKIFYYRAHYTNIDKNLDITFNEMIQNFAWVSRSELRHFLSNRKYHVIKDAIPLT